MFQSHETLKVVNSIQPKFLWFLVLSYTMAMVLANWFDVRLIQIFSLDTDAGTLIFPLTFLMSDLITEIYGYQHARQAIWCGFLFNVIFILYGQLIISLPSPEYAVINNGKFDEMLSMNFRIIIASMSSYLCSEPLNSLVMAKLKIQYKGQMLAVRFIISTLIASGIDSIIFGVIAFAGIMDSKNLITLIATMWLLKIIIELIGLPISLYLTHKLKKLERIDIYDQKTNFSLFCLQISYTEKDNQYKGN